MRPGTGPRGTSTDASPALPSNAWLLGLWRNRLRLGIDVALLAVLLGLVALQHADQPDTPWLATACSTFAVCALVLRHRFALVALVATAVLGTAGTLATDTNVVLLPVSIAVGSATAQGLRRVGVAGAIVSFVALEAALLGSGHGLGDGVVAAVPFLLALAVAVGLALDYRWRELRAVEARALQAEAARDAEARRAVAEERVRIARELHDVVAHHVAVVGVHAATAEHLVGLDPPAARAAIAQVRESSGVVLRELATLLEMLRGSGEDSRAPAPTLARLDELVDSMQRAGLAVDVTVTGTPRALAPVIDLAAYRLVQESLTNAHKHGAGSAGLLIAYGPSTLAIEVRNPLPPAAPSGEAPGYGLVGMNERAASVGGTLEAGPDTAGPTPAFVLRAALPATPAAEPTERSDA